MKLKVCTYECSFSDRWGTFSGRFTHISAGKAKASFYRNIAPHYDHIKYTDIRVRSLGAPVTDKKFMHTANYRGLPFVRVGMAVTVDSKAGVIIGSNDAANFDVVFEDGEVLNCHPYWKMRFFDEQGNEIQVNEVAA